MNCCSHLFEIGSVTPRTPNRCQECLKMGEQWIHYGFASPAVTWVVATIQRTSMRLSTFIQRIIR